MDVSSIANLATAMSQNATAQAVGIAVAKKANDVQATSAAAMLEMLPPATPANLPAHIGQNINTTA